MEKRASPRALSACWSNAAAWVSACDISACDQASESRVGQKKRSCGISHSCTVPSLLPERARRPSALKLTELTSPVCPVKVPRQPPVAISHSRTVSSLLPERAKRPSALRLTELTEYLCPVKVRRQRPVA